MNLWLINQKNWQNYSVYKTTPNANFRVRKGNRGLSRKVCAWPSVSRLVFDHLQVTITIRTAEYLACFRCWALLQKQHKKDFCKLSFAKVQKCPIPKPVQWGRFAWIIGLYAFLRLQRGCNTKNWVTSISGLPMAHRWVWIRKLQIG